ncbi:iron-containing redox enzyme family protein [Nocardioides terrisoli]|uniref:iron-containing redox enzyme family protein n=1 Tax=Nocardioides terrisoli TaxID=3388267 RepID=UPI00287B6134|nr:iron-containing redox enzyme family protein [Nocardioides marmorisolisilvae]
MLTPKPRGTLSAEVFARIHSDTSLDGLQDLRPDGVDDEQIVLWAAYELHYQGFEDVADHWEWDPGLIGVRRRLEQDFEGRLAQRLAVVEPGDEPIATLTELVEGHEGPSLARHVQRSATVEQVRELLAHRSVYHLKESDPQTWVVPRLDVAGRAALVELQYDEYGGGDPSRLHAGLFARALQAAGIPSEYGWFVNEAPVEILEMNNAMSLFGLHRRLRGAALGHLAAFEMTSSLPSRWMAQGLRRLGFPEETAEYYDEHVVADAVHEQLVLRSICGPLLGRTPALVGQVLHGAQTCLDLEDRYARRMLTQWGESA